MEKLKNSGDTVSIWREVKEEEEGMGKRLKGKRQKEVDRKDHGVKVWTLDSRERNQVSWQFFLPSLTHLFLHLHPSFPFVLFLPHIFPLQKSNYFSSWGQAWNFSWERRGDERNTRGEKRKDELHRKRGLQTIRIRMRGKGDCLANVVDDAWWEVQITSHTSNFFSFLCWSWITAQLKPKLQTKGKKRRNAQTLSDILTITSQLISPIRCERNDSMMFRWWRGLDQRIGHEIWLISITFLSQTRFFSYQLSYSFRWFSCLKCLSS